MKKTLKWLAGIAVVAVGLALLLSNMGCWWWWWYYGIGEVV